MKKTFIIFLFIIFNSSLSFAEYVGKITVGEVESIFFRDGKYISIEKKEFSKSQDHNQRLRTKGIAKCMYDLSKPSGGEDQENKCKIKIIRSALTGGERNQALKPGNIFYAFDAIEHLVYADSPKVNNSIKRKIEKFKNNPSNEKVLGHKLIKFIKKIRAVKSIREQTVGFGNFALFGDMLNESVVYNRSGGCFRGNRKSRGLEARKNLLKKYSLLLLNIKKKN